MAFSTLSANRFSSPSFPHPTPSSSNHHNRTRTEIRVTPNSKVVSLDRVETVPTEIAGIGGRKTDSHVKEKSKDPISVSEQLGLLYDDGYGSESVIDYLDAAREMARPDGAPPRWFCPIECGPPLKGSPVLLFLPGNCCWIWLISCDSLAICKMIDCCWGEVSTVRIYLKLQLAEKSWFVGLKQQINGLSCQDSEDKPFAI